MWLPWSETAYTSCCKEAAADAKGTAECQEENQMEDGWWNVLWLCLRDPSGGGGLAKEVRWYSDIPSISAVFSQHLALLNNETKPANTFELIKVLMIFHEMSTFWYELIHFQHHNHDAMFSFRAPLPWGASRCGSEASCRCGSWARGVCGFGDPFLRTSHEVHVMVTYSSLFFSKCVELDSSSMWFGMIFRPIHRFMTGFHASFILFYFFGICAHVAGWELRFTRSKGLCQVLDRCWYPFGPLEVPFYGIDSRSAFFWFGFCMIGILYGKDKVETFEKSFWLSTVRNIFSFSTCCFRVAHRCKPAQEILGWLDIAT